MALLGHYGASDRSRIFALDVMEQMERGEAMEIGDLALLKNPAATT
jgi:hypothetical protein